MLELRNVVKQYNNGKASFRALDKVSLCLRDKEFVAIQGPSGAGKTTMLNVLGGLDSCDSGELYVDGVCTSSYGARQWESYRNRKVGFVFQSYNLIPHQSVLANVELTLAIAGCSRKVRRQRAVAALEKVGLADQIHKYPKELSGGQKQRVAIARALVNDPDILLADEPTGALDTQTGEQIAALLRELAKERLVIMVTHNYELAAMYATRVITLKDGVVTQDSDPYIPERTIHAEPADAGKTKMRFLTAMHLSFHSLRAKKGRTFLAALAGSMGILGIALILSLSTGLNGYISEFRQRTMQTYPITITAENNRNLSLVDMRKLLVGDRQKLKQQLDAKLYADSSAIAASGVLNGAQTKKDLTAFKTYLSNPDSEIHKYVGKKGIVFNYDLKFTVYSYDSEGWIVRSDADTNGINDVDSLVDMIGSASGMVDALSAMLSATEESHGAENFSQLPAGSGETPISPVLRDSYDLLYGRWPEKYDEVVIVLDRNNAIDTSVLYQLGLITHTQYEEISQQIKLGENTAGVSLDFSEVCDHVFYLVPACDMYVAAQNGVFQYIGDDIPQLINKALPLKITGIIRPGRTVLTGQIPTAVSYTSMLTDYLADHTNTSPVVAAQEKNPLINVLTGVPFSTADTQQKLNDARNCISALNLQQKAALYDALTLYGMQASGDATTQQQKAAEIDSLLMDPQGETPLLLFYNRYIGTSSYEDNLQVFGKIDYNAPASIGIFTDSYEEKQAVLRCIEAYNKTVSPNQRIYCTDYVGMITQTIKSAFDAVTYCLIAFVAISLVVSGIMIAIMTGISVTERTREIGILRAIGASGISICHIFNGENMFIGVASGMMGVLAAVLLIPPINGLLAQALNTQSLSARLLPVHVLVLIALSVVITVLGGLIPALMASRKDPAIIMQD